ncbi:MAG: hypothetical protein PVS3B3_26260 [Ktedonobacteraceae bacterium]
MNLPAKKVRTLFDCATSLTVSMLLLSMAYCVRILLNGLEKVVNNSEIVLGSPPYLLKVTNIEHG